MKTLCWNTGYSNICHIQGFVHRRYQSVRISSPLPAHHGSHSSVRNGRSHLTRRPSPSCATYVISPGPGFANENQWIWKKPSKQWPKMFLSIDSPDMCCCVRSDYMHHVGQNMTGARKLPSNKLKMHQEHLQDLTSLPFRFSPYLCAFPRRCFKHVFGTKTSVSPSSRLETLYLLKCGSRGALFAVDWFVGTIWQYV